MNDHNWNNWVVPKDHYNAVFWFKLENNPQILTTASNPCEESYSPVEKSVGRYSKLIADPAIAFEMKTYSVKFSPLENRSALKIFFDSSPVDPKVIIDNIFRLRNIKIVEMPYEEDSRYTAAYENVPRDLRIGEAYNISVEQPLVGGGGTVVRPIIISPNQWLSNSNGIGYHVNLSSIIPNLYVSNGVELSIHEPWNGVGRPTRGEYFPVPKNYKNTYFTFILENHDVIINTDNLPTTSVEFSLSYNP